MNHACLTCSLAEWITTTNGHLHPSGDGRCQWQLPEIKIPACRYYVGRDKHKVPQPSGGYINRREPIAECPCHQPQPTTP